MMLTNVYFIRHAEPNVKNHDDRSRELSSKGMQDTALASSFLAGREISAVYSSPYRRAVDTVRPFAQAQGLAIDCVEAFRERCVGDEWVPSFQNFARQQWMDFSFKMPGGESLAETQTRQLAALKQLLTRHEGQNIAVGSHGTAICTLIHAWKPSFGFDDFLQLQPMMPAAVHFAFENGQCLRIDIHDLFNGSVFCVWPK